MRKILLAGALLLGVLAVAGPAPAHALSAVGGSSAPSTAGGYSTAPPPGGTGPQPGEVALGSFVAPARTRSPLVGPSAAGSWKAGPGCSVQCITSGVAYGRGPDVRLVVTTDTAATIRIVVSRSGYYQQLESDPGQTRFEVVLDDLDVDTAYDAFVSAVDGDGQMANRSGSFRSLQRDVQVWFNEAHLDHTPYGDDPFGAEIWFEGEVHWFGAVGSPADDVLPLGIFVPGAEDTDRYLEVAVELTQYEDTDDICEVSGTTEPVISHGAGECEYTAPVFFEGGSLDLDAGSGPGHWNAYDIPTELVMATPYYSPLTFSVPIGVEVTWTLG